MRRTEHALDEASEQYNRSKKNIYSNWTIKIFFSYYIL